MTYIQVLVAGLGEGALVAALAIGVVLTYRGSRVVNFSHGAIAMYAAYVFASLEADGRYVVPPLPNPLIVVEGIARLFGARVEVPSWPTFVHVGSPPLALAFVIALGTVAVFGMVIQFAVFRPLRSAPPLASTVASVGILIACRAAAVRRFGAEVQPVESVLPTSAVELGGVTISVDRLILAGIAIVLAAVLSVVYARTKFGMLSRAVAEDERTSMLLGVSPNALGGANWVLATVLAGAVGVLAAPRTGLDPSILPSMIVPALAVAVLGGLTSFGWAAAGGLGIAMTQSLVGLLQTKSWWPRGATGAPIGGAREVIPLIVVLVALLLRGRVIPVRGMAGRLRMPRSPSPLHPFRNGAIALAVLIPASLFWLSPGWRQALINSLIAAAICLSLVVISGYVGQISLVQVSLAGVAAFTLTKLANAYDVPFPLAPIAAVAASTAFGVVIGFPALRIRGVSLAIVTFAAAVAVESAVFRSEFFTSASSGGKRLELPEIFGIDVGPSSRFRDNKLPGPFFVVFVTLVVVPLFMMVANVRRSAWGRRFLAVRENERAAAASGVDVAATKLVAFGLAAFVAGVAGVLSAYRFGSISASTFGAFNSLAFLAFAFLGGVASVGGAAIAGAIASEGIVTHLVHSLADIEDLVYLFGGIGLVLATVVHPTGIAGAMSDLGRAIAAGVRRRSRHDVPGAARPDATMVVEAGEPVTVAGSKSGSPP